jgi:hypothetical protein
LIRGTEMLAKQISERYEILLVLALSKSKEQEIVR